MPGTKAELSLDPANWTEFRELAHRMVDEMPRDVRDSFTAPLPNTGAGDRAAYDAFVDIRVANVNQRSTSSDFVALADAVVALGREVSS